MPIAICKLSHLILAGLAVGLLAPEPMQAGGQEAKASAQQADGKAAGLPLFPLKKGLKWEMKHDEVKALGGRIYRINFQITGTTVRRDLVCYELITRLEFEEKNAAASVLHSYIAAKEDGLYVVAGSFKGGYTSYFDPPMCILKPPSEKAQKWAWDGKEVCDNGVTNRDKHTFFQYPDQIKHNGKEVDAVVVVDEHKERNQEERIGMPSFKTWYVPGKGPIRRESYANGKPTETDVTLSFSGDGSITFGKVVFNKNSDGSFKDTYKDTDEYVEVETPVAATVTKKVTRTLQREISWSVKGELSTEAAAKFRAGLLLARADFNSRIKASIAAERAAKWTDKIEEEVSLSIPLEKNSKVRLIWVDIYRTGTVEASADGKTQLLQFEFPVATKLVVRQIK